MKKKKDIFVFTTSTIFIVILFFISLGTIVHFKYKQHYIEPNYLTEECDLRKNHFKYDKKVGKQICIPDKLE